MKKRYVWILALTALIYAVPSLAAPVIRGGKEWLQPADFTDLSWNDVVAVCPEPDFLCDGELNGNDVTGYYFASIEQVTDLFNSYGIDPPLGPAPASVSEIDSTWAPAFSHEFAPTEITLEGDFVDCISSTKWLNTVLPVGRVWDLHGAAAADRAYTNDTAGSDFGWEGRGVCLCRDAPPPAAKAVPTMSTYVLIFTMLGLIAIASGGLFRRRFGDR